MLGSCQDGPCHDLWIGYNNIKYSPIIFSVDSEKNVRIHHFKIAESEGKSCT